MKLLGIDLGGTNIKAGICTPSGRILARASIPTDAGKGPADVVARIAALARSLGAADLAGIGVPGPLDRARTILHRAANLKGWKKVPFPRLLRKRLGIPAVMENDANVAALAEARLGAGIGASSMVLLTLGTGVGGGIVLEDRLWIGANGGAGELGHIVVDPRGPLCGCGRRGCLEQYSSATAVVRRYRALGGGQATAREVFAAREPKARRAVAEACDALGAGIAAILLVLHPERIVLAGGMAAAGRRLFELVKRATSKRVDPLFMKGLKILPGRLGNDAGWLGAALVAHDRSRA